MWNLTIRNLDNDLKARLRRRAARHHRSMEDEARDILQIALSRHREPANLAAVIRARFLPLKGAEIPLPLREPMREPPDFES
jgi:plasmid stability protein